MWPTNKALIYYVTLDMENRRECFDWNLFLTKALLRQSLDAG